MSDLTPREIVVELDRYIVGQHSAKRAVAIAVRNRWRRARLPDSIRDEVLPKNIIMIGPTGVGKTEIARRLATLVRAPFVKVEASKFTEVGYVGRDVESIIRDLMEAGVALVRAEALEAVREQAREILTEQEAEKLIDRHTVSREARRRAEQDGIIFLDEMDKIAGRESAQGPDVSREGVQRDLLPIVEGSTVATKYGPVKTDHILFLAAGAFHVAKPADLIPELQGRFPIRVELSALTRDDLVRILTEPENALTKQYAALLSAEGVRLEFTADAVQELARLAVEVNARSENIGARRLATLLERLLEEISFEAPDMQGVEVTLDGETVRRTLTDIVHDEDLSRYVL